MAESPQSTASRDSQDETAESRSKTVAVKDKKCQYCGQAFTSSSLGRHLDQFISKKKPDGIHDVDEIRKLRGGITRRTARQPRGGEQDEHSRSNGTPVASHASPPVIDHLNVVPPGGVKNSLNALDWHATGVINNLSAPSPSILNPPTKRSFSTYSADSANTSDKDTARALELALREVLDSIRAATARAAPRLQPLDFDLESQTFPSLCIRLLPRPPTLFTTSPFATSSSCPLEAPHQAHLDLLRKTLNWRIERWKWDRLRAVQSHSSASITGSANMGEEADHLSRIGAQYSEMANQHLDLAFSQWTSLTPEKQTQIWQLEIMRAFAREQDRNKELEDRIDRVTREANQLQMEVEYLSRCQWPREMALWPPERPRFTKEEIDEIRGISMDHAKSSTTTADADDQRQSGSSQNSSHDGPASFRNHNHAKWDFDRLVNKWKKHVREDKSRRTGVATVSTVFPSLATAAAASTITATPTATTYPSTTATTLAKTQSSDLSWKTNGGGVGVNGSPPDGGGGSGEDAARKKPLKQSQQQSYLVGEQADKTDEVREFLYDLASSKARGG